MNYYEKHRQIIDDGEIDQRNPTQAELDDPALCSEIADCIMDSCAEELHACDPATLTPETRERLERVLAAIKGTELSSKLMLHRHQDLNQP